MDRQNLSERAMCKQGKQSHTQCSELHPHAQGNQACTHDNASGR